MRPRVLLVAALVVLAGCSGVFGESDQTTETVTPAAVPTDEPTPTPVPQLAPGLTGAGIENPSVLVGAHTSVLQNKSFTQKSNTTGLAQNGSFLFRTTGTLHSGPAGEEVYSISERNGNYGSPNGLSYPIRSEAWANSGRLFMKRIYSNGTTTYDRFEQQYGASGAGLQYQIKQFGTPNTSVTKRKRNGSTLYLVRGNTQINEAYRQENINLRMIVDSRGFIHSYRTVREVEFDEDIARIISESRYSKIGATNAPERPSWVATAKNRTTPTAGSQN